MARNVAMQAAALKPMYTNRDEVDADYIAKETEIITAAAKNEKPDANDKIIEGMVKGRINKELKEICLLDQVYVKAEDGKQSVSAYVASVAKENNANRRRYRKEERRLRSRSCSTVKVIFDSNHALIIQINHNSPQIAGKTGGLGTFVLC